MDEEFKRKDYFYSLRLEDVRLKFKSESRVVPTIRNHFKRKYRSRSLNCPSCQVTSLSIPEEEGNEMLDTSRHILYHCPAFREQRLHRNFEDDQDLVDFLNEIIKYRIANDEH